MEESNAKSGKSEPRKLSRSRGRSKSFHRDEYLEYIQKLEEPKKRPRMDRNARRHYSTLLETNADMFLSELSSGMKANQNDKVHELLTIMEDKKRTLHCVKFYREGEDKSETLLHVAVKYEDDIDTIIRIIKICPDLLSLARETSKKYKGQTPLHISITRGDYEVTNLLLSFVSASEVDMPKKSSNRTKMINTRAIGVIFANTVMMGELPLSVAALTFNSKMVKLLLDHGADMHAQNGYGDTILHSLVKYSAVYPNKVDDVINMFNYLNEQMRDDKNNTMRFRGTDFTL